MKKKTELLPTKEDVKKYKLLFVVLQNDIAEIRLMAEKNNHDQLNLFKTKTINKQLKQIKEFLAKEPSSEFIEILDESKLPTNSDAVLIMSRFAQAMELYKSRYYDSDGSEFGMVRNSKAWKTSD